MLVVERVEHGELDDAFEVAHVGQDPSDGVQLAKKGHFELVVVPMAPLPVARPCTYHRSIDTVAR